MTHSNQHNGRKNLPQSGRGIPLRDDVALLTIDEACGQLRISRWTLYRLIHRRAIRTVKIGNRRLIPPAAIDELIRGLEDQETWS